jgi:hypothetical protein
MEYKGYLITPASTGAKCYSIATAGRGGKIPDVMQGVFTSTGVAMQTVDIYLDGKEKKVKTDAEETSKG